MKKFILIVGGDLSIILNPKIALKLGAKQRFQGEQKTNDYQNSELHSILTFSLSSTIALMRIPLYRLMVVLEAVWQLLMVFDLSL